MPSSDPNLSKNLSRGYISALVSAGFLSTTSILISYLTQTFQIPALVLAFWRDLFVVVGLFPILIIFKPILLKIYQGHLFHLISYGLVLAVFNSLWTFSVTFNGAAVSTVLAYSSVGFTALLGWWLLKERLDWGKIFTIVLTLGGCVLVSGAFVPEAWNSNSMGIITGILSGLAYALYALMGRKASQDGLNPWTTLLYTFAFAAFFLFIFNLVLDSLLPSGTTFYSGMFWLGDQTIGWVVLFLLAVGPTLAGFGFYNVSLVHLQASIANLVVTVEPVFTILIAYILLHERLDYMQIIGSFLILGGIIFLRLYEDHIKQY